MDLKYECKQCYQRFESRTQLAKHMYLHKQGHICTHCNKPFGSESGLKRHINANHTSQRTSFKCTICDCSFRLKRDFEKHHLSEHRADKHFECKLCGARFSWLINLTKHEKFHNDQKDPSEPHEAMKEDVKKLFQCEICGKNFNYDFTYAIHLAGHEKATNNDDSMNTTTDINTTVDSITEVEGDDESVAEVDGSKVGDGKEVMNYIPSEEENKDLFEFLNDCRSRREGKLKRKRKDEVIYDFVMTENKPFKCTKCDEAFRWQVSLDIHLKVHSGTKTLKVRKPYLSSKMAIAEKLKLKKGVKSLKKEEKKNGDQNVSKIIYQNESDEDNDIYEEEDEEDDGGGGQEGKVKIINMKSELVTNKKVAHENKKLVKEENKFVKDNKKLLSLSNNTNKKINTTNNTTTTTYSNDNNNDDEEDDDNCEEGMNAIDLLNSIGKSQTINHHDYL